LQLNERLKLIFIEFYTSIEASRMIVTKDGKKREKRMEMLKCHHWKDHKKNSSRAFF
jgi:hypothetical protein